MDMNFPDHAFQRIQIVCWREGETGRTDKGGGETFTPLRTLSC